MNDQTTSPPPPGHRMPPEELRSWERDGYFVRHGVFSAAENDRLRQVAEDVVAVDE